MNLDTNNLLFNKNYVIINDNKYILNIFTFATDSNKIKFLKDSQNLFDIKINYIMKKEWNGFQDKILFTYDIIKKLPDTEIALFIDAYDVLINSNINEIITKFLKYECDILFSAELNCHPRYLKKEYIKICPKNEENCYINSGGYMGYIKNLKEFYEWKKSEEIIKICENGVIDKYKQPGDQAYFIKFYIEHHDKVNVKLDTESKIFQNMYLISWHKFNFINGRLFNNYLKNYPCFIHFNGKTYETNTQENIMPVFINKMILSKNNNNIYNLNEYKQKQNKNFNPY